MNEKKDELQLEKTDKVSPSKRLLAADIPVWQKILKISLPLVLLSLSNASFVLVDAILAIKLTDYGPNTSAAAILGIIIPLLMLTTSFVMIVIVGTSVSVSRKLGQNNYKGAEKVFGQGIFLAFSYGIFIFLALFFIAGPWVNFINDLIPSNNPSHLNSQAVDDGIKYLRITGGALVIMIIRDVITRTLRTEGRSLASAIIPIIALPINILLDWVFMGVLNMGLEGAAYATLIATAFGAFLAIVYIFYLDKFDSTHINFKISNISPDGNEIKDIFLFGSGPFFRRLGQSLFMIVATIYVVLLSKNYQSSDYWKDFLTAASRSIAFVMIVGLAFIQGSTLIISYYYGKKDYEKLKETVKISAFFVLIVDGLAAIILIILANPILSLFGIEDNSMHSYKKAFYILAAAIPLLGLSQVFFNFYTATKKVKFAVFNSLFGTVFLGSSILLLFYYCFYLPSGNTSLFFLGYLVAWIVEIEILFPIFYYQYKNIN